MRSIGITLIVVALAACNQNEGATDEAAARTGTASPAAGTAERPTAVAPDNTGKNERDRGVNALTPGDQKENESDLSITQNVRQAVSGRDDLSTNAQNVKIVTQDGVVTLRGPVGSEGEKSTIVDLAKRSQGVRRVDTQLEVTGAGSPSAEPDHVQPKAKR